MFVHDIILWLVYAYAGVYSYFRRRYGMPVALAAAAVLPTAVVTATVVALFQLT